MLSPEHIPEEEAVKRENPDSLAQTEAANEAVFPAEVANRLFESRTIIGKFTKEPDQIEKLREIRAFFEKILKNLGSRDLNKETEDNLVMGKRMKAIKISIEAEIKEINKLT